jgi:hypothetical protein
MSREIHELHSKPLFSLKLNVDYANRVPFGPVNGSKAVSLFPVSTGVFKGERLNGTVLSGGSDWVTWPDDTTMQIDVRLPLLTDDGVHIAMSYKGVAHGSPEDIARFKNLEVLPYGVISVHVVATFMVDSPKYDWLSKVIAVANGMRTDNGPLYHFFEIV